VCAAVKINGGPLNKGNLRMKSHSESSDPRRLRRSRVGRPLIWALASAGVFLVPSPAGCDEPDGEPIDPIAALAAYRKALPQLRATYSNVAIEGTGRFVTTPHRLAAEKAKAAGRRAPQGTDAKWEFAYAFCEGKEKRAISPLAGRNRGGTQVVVDDGQARFTARSDGPGRPYSVRAHSKDRDDAEPASELRIHVRDAPYRPEGLKEFEQFVASPHFSIERAVRRRGAAGAVLSLLVHYRPPNEQELHIDGRVELDEGLGLVIRYYKLETGRTLSGGKRFRMEGEGSVEYNQENGKAIPTSVNFGTHEIPADGRSARWEYTISKYSLGCSTPSEEFTLAHYGLGDFERTLGQAEARSTCRSAATALAFLIGVVLLILGWRAYKTRSGARTTAQAAAGSGSPTLDQAT
jgi:hypothetical protein